MRPLLEVTALAAAMTLVSGTPVFAQSAEDWAAPMGEVTAGFPAGAKLRFLLATPTDTPEETAAAQALQKLLLDAGIGSVVMDDSPLGALTGLSDDEILKRAKVYPVDVVAIIRAFPGSDGNSVMVRVESQDGGTRAFSLQPSGETAAVVVEAPEEPPVAPATEEVAQEEATPPVAPNEPAEPAQPAEPAVPAVAPWTFETEPGFGRVVEGPVTVPWPRVYDELGDDELRVSFQRRRTVRTTAFITGGVLAAAGTGLIYTTVLGSAGCTDCRNDALFGAGIGALSVGAVALLVGFVVDRHPVDADELRQLVLLRNERASR